MTPADKLIKTAKSYVGYFGKKTNSQLDDFTANKSGLYNKFARDLDSLGDWYNGRKNGYDWCFPSGTFILTSDGYKDIKDICIGDSVLNAQGDSFNTITHIETHEATIVDLSVYGAVHTNVTKNHPFLSKKRVSKWHRKKEFTSYGFNPIETLEKHDVVCIPKTLKVKESGLTKNELWAIGYYVGDGIKYRSHYILCGNDKKIEAVSQHIDIIYEKRKYESRTCQQVKLDIEKHPKMIEVLEDCGRGALHKRVPKQILFGSYDDKIAFLSGYLCADGFCIDNRYGFTTVSKELTIGLSRIIFDIGYGCSIVTTKRPPKGQIFDKRLGTIKTFNQQEIVYTGRINANTNKAKQLHIFENNLTFVPIKSIEELDKPELVYTLTTDGDHTYTANNLSVHNCDVFVDWCFYNTFGKDLALALTCQPLKSLGAGTKYSMNYYKNKGQFYTKDPKPGDQVFFNFTNNPSTVSHTGLVEKVVGNYVYTIEGNSGSPSAVRGCRYPLTYKSIIGYGRPNWTIVPNKTPPTNEFPSKDDNQSNNVKDDEDMDINKFKELYKEMRKEWQDNDAGEWSKESREWAIANGLIKGNGSGNYMYEDHITREQMIEVLYRFAQKNGLV